MPPEPVPPSEVAVVGLSGTTTALAAAWDARAAHLLTKLPQRVQSGVAWLRHPTRRLWRLLTGVLLIAGGMLAILPVLGLWMLPLGLALLSDDFPGLKVWLEKSARGLGRLWRRVRRRPG